ncbi:hypothetical protein MON38_11325 [Hymenobacter sp. DH14]|uniref:Uncharacterized protein n=1 Tax=Hymenobacter cyanobacteriorum TaxID=2926463 RepID=A0A9X1VGX2_9BACT|nr:hypothetical protein [Hymenobacter cyanobacteriorum]MCI1188012.1 hypothetical protein [Hymenobacter cyanobacteriorum]
MKHFLPLLGLLLLGWATCQPVAAQATDTLPGHNRFARLIANSLCTRIQAEGQRQDLEKLTPKQADDLFLRLMMTSMSEHASEFTDLISAGKRRGLSSNKIGHDMGETAVKMLSVDCPGSMKLILRTSSAQKGLGPKGQQSMNNISEEERAVLQPMADSVCVQLSAEDARHPLKAMTVAGRSETMSKIMQTTVIKNMPALMTVYSTEQLGNKESMEAFGIKLATLMMSKCPTYLIMLGEDAKKKR